MAYLLFGYVSPQKVTIGSQGVPSGQRQTLHGVYQPLPEFSLRLCTGQGSCTRCAEARVRSAFADRTAIEARSNGSTRGALAQCGFRKRESIQFDRDVNAW